MGPVELVAELISDCGFFVGTYERPRYGVSYRDLDIAMVNCTDIASGRQRHRVE